MAIYARRQFSVTDQAGNVQPGAWIEVKLALVGGTPLATLYQDRAGAIPLSNPFQADGNGEAFYHSAGGVHRIRAYVGPSGAPLFEKIWPLVAIGTIDELDYDVDPTLAANSDALLATQKAVKAYVDAVVATITALSTQREATAAGDVIIAPDDAAIIYIAKTVAAASRVVLPLSSERTRRVRVVDGNRDAATNNITLVPKRPDTVTVTIASPGVFTKVAHGLAVNQPVSLETSGALPTGLAADTQYYVKTVPTADTYTLAASPGGAVINTSGTQSGVHKMGTDTIMGGASFVIDSNGGSIELGPRTGGVRGWF